MKKLLCKPCAKALEARGKTVKPAAITTSTQASNMEVSGTDSVGTLLASAISTQAEAEDNADCYIADLEINGMVADVEYQTTTDSEVVVAIYDEDSGQMVASGMSTVSSTDNFVQVQIEAAQMPEYFVATAYLLDAENHFPLSKEYTVNLYTREMKEFLSKTVDDFDQDLVLNLDDAAETNFMVYNSNITLAREDTSNLDLTDNNDGTYTVYSPNETVNSLKAGDILSYTYADGTVLLVKVSEVSSVNGTLIIVEEDKVELGDFFDYVKIEVGYDKEDDDRNKNTEVAPLSLDLPDGSYEPGVSTSQTIYVEKEFKDEDVGSSVSLKLSGTFSANIKLKLYIEEKKITYMDFATNVSLAFALSLSGSIKATVDLLPIPIGLSPLPGLYIEFMPQFVVEANVKIETSLTMTLTIGFTVDSDKYTNKSVGPKIDWKVAIDGTLFIGIALTPSIKVIGDVFEIKVTGKIGAEIKGTMAIAQAEIKGTMATAQSGDSKKHLCGACIVGEISGKLSVSADFLAFWKIFRKTVTLINVTCKFSDFYYSNDYKEFGFGTCPHISYKVTLKVQDEAGIPISSAMISGTGLGQAPVTDDGGTAVFYLPNGKYTLTASNGTISASKQIIILNNGKTLTLTLNNAGGSGTTDPDEGDDKPGGGDQDKENTINVGGFLLDEIDKSGIVANYTVCATDNPNKAIVESTTGITGVFEFDIPAGEYTITFVGDGFEPLLRK